MDLGDTEGGRLHSHPSKSVNIPLFRSNTIKKLHVSAFSFHCIVFIAAILHQVRSYGRSISSTVLWAPTPTVDFSGKKILINPISLADQGVTLGAPPSPRTKLLSISCPYRVGLPLNNPGSAPTSKSRFPTFSVKLTSATRHLADILELTLRRSTRRS